MKNKKIYMLITILMLFSGIAYADIVEDLINLFSGSDNKDALDTPKELIVSYSNPSWKLIKDDIKIDSKFTGEELIISGKDPLPIYENDILQLSAKNYVPNKNSVVRVGTGSDIYVYQNETKVIFNNSEYGYVLEQTLYKWNGVDWVLAPDIVYVNNSDETRLKSNAVDTNPLNSTEGSINPYKWTWTIEGKPIENEGNKYYVQENSICFNDNQYHQTCNQQIREIDNSIDCNNDYANCQYYLNNESEYLEMTFYAKNINGIVNIDPSYNLAYTTASGFALTHNRTEASSNGARLVASLLFMDFNTREENFTATTKYVKDGSIYNNYGTINLTNTNPTYNSTGGYDGSGAYRFDGVDDYITLPNSNNIISSNNILTMSAWIKTSDCVSSTNTYVGARVITFQESAATSSISLGLNGSCNIAGLTRSGTTAIEFAGSVATTDSWHMITLVKNGAIHQLYLDGIASGSSVNYTPTNNFGAVPTFIGNDGSFARQFNGSIDQVTILPYALTASEVLCLYNGTGAGCGGRNNSAYLSKYAYPSGDFKSGVFYNSTQTYWNISLSTADTTSRSGIVNADNSINLSHPNLISYWALDGNYLDAKGINNGTTINSSTTPNNATGLSSGALRFDGGHDVINVTDSNNGLDGIGNLSLSMWFNINKISDQFIITKKDGTWNDANGWYIGYEDDTNDYIYLVGSGSSSAYAYYTATVGQWTHLVVIASGTTVQFYINGQNISAFDNSITAITGNTGNLGIGDEMWAAAYDNSFNGTMDEVLIYNTSLTASQVSQIYKSGLSQHANTNVTIQTRTANTYNITDPSLIAFWSFNENLSGNNVADEKGRFNGTRFGSIADPNGENGTVGKGYYFDDTNDYISFGNSSTFNPANKTISLWLKPGSTTTDDYYFGELNSAGTIGWYLRKVNSKYYYAVASSASDYKVWGSTNNVVTTNWQSLIITQDNVTSTPLFYLDGINISVTLSLSSGTLVQPQNLNFSIGRAGDYNSGYWSGSIDEVRIYNRTLSAAEAKNLYELGSYHISNWSAWSPESLVTDNIANSFNGKGKFMQFKTNFYTNDTLISPYVINHSITSGGETDLTPPSITLVYPLNNSVFNLNYSGHINVSLNENGNCTLNDTRWDYNSGNTTFASFLNNTGIGMGIYNINVSCNDTINNRNSTILYFNITEFIKPYFVFIPNNITNLSYNTPLHVNFTGNDTHSPPVNYSVNNSNFYIYQNGSLMNNTILGIGTHYLNITITDQRGNTNSTLWYVNVTSIPPSITILFPTATTYNYDNLDFNITIENSTGLNNCYYNLGAGNVNTPCGTNLSFAAVSEGTHTWTYYANDTLGVIGSDSVTFDINLPPTLSVTSPMNTTYYSTNINLQGSCTNTESTPSLKYSLDEGANTSFTFDTIIATSGYEVYHNLTVWCNDSLSAVSITKRFYVGLPASNFTTNPTNIAFLWRIKNATDNTIKNVSWIEKSGIFNVATCIRIGNISIGIC